MQAAVDRRRVSDVPVGVLLSGGLDSSLIVALLAEHGQPGIHTFSIGFESVGNMKVTNFDTRTSSPSASPPTHQQIRIDADGAARRAARRDHGHVRADGEPRCGRLLSPVGRKWRSTSRWCRAARAPTRCSAAITGIRRSLTCRTMPLEHYARSISTGRHADIATAAGAEYFVSEDLSRDFRRWRSSRTPARRPPIDKALQLDTEIMLVDDPVKRVDNMTMAWGLEARVPFLDHELVELAARIPAGPEGQGRREIHPQGSRAAASAGRDHRPAQGLFPRAVAAISARSFSRSMCATALDQRTAKTRGLFRRFCVDMLAHPGAEIEPERPFPAVASAFWKDGCRPINLILAFDFDLLKKLRLGLSEDREHLVIRSATGRERNPEYSFGIEEEYFLADARDARRRHADAERAVRSRELVDRRPGHARDAAGAARGRDQCPCRRARRARGAELSAPRGRQGRRAIRLCHHGLRHPSDRGLADVAAEPEAALRGDDRGSRAASATATCCAACMCMCSFPISEKRFAVMRAMIPYLPLFIALSTSSPFWHSHKTGLKGYRLAAYDELPRTGIARTVRNRAGVRRLCRGAEEVRRHPRRELRLVGDAALAAASDARTARARHLHPVEDALAIASLYRVAGAPSLSAPQLSHGVTSVDRAIAVENKWRAQRYGTDCIFARRTDRLHRGARRG